MNPAAGGRSRRGLVYQVGFIPGIAGALKRLENRQINTIRLPVVLLIDNNGQPVPVAIVPGNRIQGNRHRFQGCHAAGTDPGTEKTELTAAVSGGRFGFLILFRAAAARIRAGPGVSAAAKPELSHYSRSAFAGFLGGFRQP